MKGSDTQWPRYQVFHKAGPDKPHLNAGTVHATDPEMALQNARDVFVRRPDCISLWVAPASAISSWTADEVENSDPLSDDDPGTPEAYAVFLKLTQIGSHEHVGSVVAGSPHDALRKAAEEHHGKTVLVWWVVPEHAFERTEGDEIDSLFRPAEGKLYRDPGFYHTVTLMRRLREQKQ